MPRKPAAIGWSYRSPGNPQLIGQTNEHGSPHLINVIHAINGDFPKKDIGMRQTVKRGVSQVGRNECSGG
jgi:hypothetical protein